MALRALAERGRRVTVPPSQPRRYQNLWPNPARSLVFCAPGWRVTWPPRDPRIPAFSPAGPRTSTPRLARDSLVAQSPILVAGIDIVAAAHAHRHDSPARVETVAVAPAAVDDGAGNVSCRPSVSSVPSSQSENRLGTRCTASNNPAASAVLCRVSPPFPAPLSVRSLPSVSPGVGHFW